MVELVVPALPWAKNLELFRSKERDIGWRGRLKVGTGAGHKSSDGGLRSTKWRAENNLTLELKLTTPIPNFDNNQTHQGEKPI